jgi:hypothetical protein
LQAAILRQLNHLAKEEERIHSISDNKPYLCHTLTMDEQVSMMKGISELLVSFYLSITTRISSRDENTNDSSLMMDFSLKVVQQSLTIGFRFSFVAQ